MANARPVRRLPGFRDTGAREQAVRQAAVETCRRRFELRGYGWLDTPYLEETELFLRKSGGELSSRLCSFTDPAGYAVSLRPEFTAPVLRHVIEAGSPEGLPLRVQYAGAVFRYAARADAEDAGPESRQFTQVGAELIGGAGARADGEILAMALDGLNALLVPGPSLVLGHVGLLWELLRPFSLSDRGRLFLVSRVGELSRGAGEVAAARDRARELGLLPAGRGAAGGVGDRGAGESPALVESVLRRTVAGSVGVAPGARAPGEIVSRLARKVTSAEKPVLFDEALELLGELATVRGPLDAALEEGRAVVRRRGRDEAPFDRMERAVEAVLDEGVARDAVMVDFGLARGIAYYTGMVFDLVAAGGGRGPQGRGRGLSLGGGGRYDGLPRALGAAVDIPALGFAYNLDAVLAVAPEEAPPPPGRRVVVAAEDAAAAAAAARHAAKLRSEGVVALVEVDTRSPEERRAYAKARGASEVARVSARGAVRLEAV